MRRSGGKGLARLAVSIEGREDFKGKIGVLSSLRIQRTKGYVAYLTESEVRERASQVMRRAQKSVGRLLTEDRASDHDAFDIFLSHSPVAAGRLSRWSAFNSAFSVWQSNSAERSILSIQLKTLIIKCAHCRLPLQKNAIQSIPRR